MFQGITKHLVFNLKSMQSKHTKKTEVLDKIERVIRGVHLRSMGSEGDVLMALAHFLWEEGENARAEWREMHYKALSGSDESVNYIYALALPDYGILMDRSGNFGWTAILNAKYDELEKHLGRSPHMLYFTDDATHIRRHDLIDSYKAEVIREKIRAKVPDIEALAIDQLTPKVSTMARARRI